MNADEKEIVEYTDNTDNTDNNTLYMEMAIFKSIIRVPAFITTAVTRVESAHFSHFCRYSCISGNIIK